MKSLSGLPAILIIFAVLVNQVHLRMVEMVDAEFEAQSYVLKRLSENMEAMKKIIGALGRQMLLQQLFVEEKIRSDGDSGVKQTRLTFDGTRNYYTATHTGESVASIHDHSNNIRTVGMGEFIGVLNGVEFRTRHNDYRLYMPHRTKKDWHATEDIPFPDVPPEVLSKPTISEQIKEMRAWFKAWKDQDYSTRDYRKYFKPVLCYLEGAWTTSTKGKVEEPFESDRHFVDASSWFDLQEKVRFISYTGRKENLENIAFLPTTIMNVTEDGYPEFAQWNYRILCHPISRDLPLNRLRVVDELGLRMSNRRTLEQHAMSRAARFQLNPFDTDTWMSERKNTANWGLLDELMSEIPGKDNYPGKLIDKGFDLPAHTMNPKQQKIRLRADRYQRWFKSPIKGAMGIFARHRGFSDENLFMAMNTQRKVVGLDLTVCKQSWINGKKRRRRRQRNVCKTTNQKWSYAIPLEIIYLTPLNNWNPYDIKYKRRGRTVEAGGRNGGFTVDKAFNGTNSKNFYQTPEEFFSGQEVSSGAAEKIKDPAGVLDKKGNVHKCKASGTRIFFPPIPGVGVLRQRYPIMPIHGEGSSVWKELEATKDLLLNSKTYGYLFKESLDSMSMLNDPPRKGVKLRLLQAIKNPPGPHSHEITLTAEQVDFLKNAGRLNVTSTQSTGHYHNMEVTWKQKDGLFVIDQCDDADTKSTRCWDQHPAELVQMPDV